MKRVPTAEVKKRSRELTLLFESFNPYSGMEGKVEKAWVTDVASDGFNLVSDALCFAFVLLAQITLTCFDCDLLQVYRMDTFYVYFINVIVLN